MRVHARPQGACACAPLERRVARARRETASEAPSPGQLTELAGAVPMSRSGGFPRRRRGAQAQVPCGLSMTRSLTLIHSRTRSAGLLSVHGRCFFELRGNFPRELLRGDDVRQRTEAENPALERAIGAYVER